jgi:hypothetical protein
MIELIAPELIVPLSRREDRRRTIRDIERTLLMGTARATRGGPPKWTLTSRYWWMRLRIWRRSSCPPPISQPGSIPGGGITKIPDEILALWLSAW